MKNVDCICSDDYKKSNKIRIISFYEICLTVRK